MDKKITIIDMCAVMNYCNNTNSKINRKLNQLYYVNLKTIVLTNKTVDFTQNENLFSLF